MSNEKIIDNALNSNFQTLIFINSSKEQIVEEGRKLGISSEDIYLFDPVSENFEVLKDLKRSFSIPPNASRFKIFIVENADSLSGEMANSLLKIAEEPPEYLKVILITENLKRILPTIRSRSQAFFLPKQAGESDSKFLQLFSGGDFKSWVDFLKEEEDFSAHIKVALADMKKKGLNVNRQLYIDLSELLVKFENTNINQKLHLENLFVKFNFK